MHSSRMHTAHSLTVSWGDVCPGGWPIPSCIWCYLYAVPDPTETEEQCSCLYSGGHVTWQVILGYTPALWIEFLTHAWENITFLQLLLRAVKSIAYHSPYRCKTDAVNSRDHPIRGHLWRYHLSSSHSFPCFHRFGKPSISHPEVYRPWVSTSLLVAYQSVQPISSDISPYFIRGFRK